MQRGVVQNTSELQQDSPIGDFNWATNFPEGEGDRSHSGHQACRWPLRDIASRENFKNIYSFEHCTLLEDFRNKKNEYHFYVGAV